VPHTTSHFLFSLALSLSLRLQRVKHSRFHVRHPVHNGRIGCCHGFFIIVWSCMQQRIPSSDANTEMRYAQSVDVVIITLIL
jgi:hypothetical protein